MILNTSSKTSTDTTKTISNHTTLFNQIKKITTKVNTNHTPIPKKPKKKKNVKISNYKNKA